MLAFGSAPEPLASVKRFLRGTVTSAPELEARLLFVAIAAALAGIASPRVTLGAAVWMRSLPAAGRTVRLAAAIVLVAAQVVALAYLPIAVVLATTWLHLPISITRIVALLVAVCAVAVMSVAAGWTARALALGAIAISIASTPTSIVVAIVLIACALAMPGDVAAPARRRSTWRWRIRSRRTSRMSGMTVWRRILWRGIGLRRLIGCALIPLLICAYAYFITTNNPQLDAGEAASVVRWSGGIAVAFMASALANVVLISRQPWPWSRSLPWSAGDRVLADAHVIGAMVVVIPVLLLPVGVLAALETAAIVPLAALLGASAVRAGGSRQSGAAGETLLVVGVAAILVALWPIVALLELALSVPAYRWAVRRDRNLRGSRWLELHHDAESDPLWSTNG